TLARSCSTTELHPHPRWRRSLAVNGRAMPNADRECNSSLTAGRHPENLISATNGRESVRNNGQTGFRRPISGTWGLRPALEGDSRPFTDPAPNRRGHSPRRPAGGRLRLLGSARSHETDGAVGRIEFCGQTAI